MKKTILLSVLAGIASLASAIEPSDVYVRATPTLSFNTGGDLSGLGLGAKIAGGYKTNWLGLNDAIELEFNYTYFEGTKTNNFSNSISIKQKAEVNRYMLMANYCLNNTIGEGNFFWYGGAGIGIAFLQGKQSANVTGSGVNENIDIPSHVNKVSPAAQVFLGLGYNINENFSLYAGGNITATQKVTFFTKYNDGEPIESKDNMTLEPISLGVEVGAKYAF
jgi:opacity protein-like surface antigen